MFRNFVILNKTFPSQAEACARACAIALGFSIPISVALDNVLLGLMLIAWFASGRYREKLLFVAQNRIAAASLILFCLLGAGLTYSYAGFDQSLRSLDKYIDLAFVPVFASLFRDARTRHLAWLAFAMALAVTLLLSYMTWLGLLAETHLTLGTPQNPEVFKRYLTQGIFLAFGAYVFVTLALQARSMGMRRTWLGLGLLAAINVLVLTQSRTGQLILLALVLHYAYTQWRWKGAAGAAVAGVLVLGLISGFNGASRQTATLGELQSWKPGLAATASTGFRIEFYSNSLEIARAHPWLGTGTGSFAKVYAEHVQGSAMLPTVNPHNEYLNIAIQLGIAGLAAMLYLFYCEWRLAPALPTAGERRLARALVITFVIGCTFNSLLMDHAEGLFFAWASGLLFAGLPAPLPVVGWRGVSR